MRTIMTKGPMLPVVTIDDAAIASDLAAALLEGGITVIEVTLRTPQALAAVAQIARDQPAMTVGVGTVIQQRDLDAAHDAGAHFAVSPGFIPALVDHAQSLNLPYLPGIQTASEALQAVRMGLTELKFFPALSSGGPAHLTQLQPLFPELLFCPTGGLDFDNAAAFLALSNVACVGGSFATPKAIITARDWPAITALAARASQL